METFVESSLGRKSRTCRKRTAATGIATLLIIGSAWGAYAQAPIGEMPDRPPVADTPRPPISTPRPLAPAQPRDTPPALPKLGQPIANDACPHQCKPVSSRSGCKVEDIVIRPVGGPRVANDEDVGKAIGALHILHIGEIIAAIASIGAGAANAAVGATEEDILERSIEAGVHTAAEIGHTEVGSDTIEKAKKLIEKLHELSNNWKKMGAVYVTLKVGFFTCVQRECERYNEMEEVLLYRPEGDVPPAVIEKLPPMPGASAGVGEGPDDSWAPGRFDMEQPAVARYVKEKADFLCTFH